MQTQLILLTSVGVAATVIFGTIWLIRSRDARRVRNAANLHAAREIAQEARWKARKTRVRATANSN